MRRRDFIISIGGAATWPLDARGQQPERVRRIGVLMGYPENDTEAQAYITAFRDELRKLGWVEGRNIRIDTRWTTSADTDSVQRFAKELIALQPDLILSNTTPTTTALLQQTRTIPIIFAMVADPLGSGFVASFPKPGGNVTGFATIEGSLGGKWVELLREISPHVARTALLFNPATAPFFEYYVKSFNDAAASFGLEAVTAPVHDMSELESVVTALARVPSTIPIVMALVLGKPASHNGIAHVAFDHNDSLRSREFIISWLNHTPHARCVRFVFGVTAASRNTRYQAAC